MTNPPWHQRELAAYHHLVDAVRRAFPGLDVEARGARLVIAGEILLHADGHVLDHYHVEIELPPDGPRAGLPVVRETGGRIPRTLERHINADGTCCVLLPDQFWFEHPQGMEAVDFVDGPVRGYFVGQSHFEAAGTWPYGEYGHGGEGIAQFYRRLFEVDDDAVVFALLAAVGNQRLSGRRGCPCTSGRAACECHGERLLELAERVPVSCLKSSVQQLRLQVLAGRMMA